MGKILRILVVGVALAASAGATIRAADALPSESLVVTASSLGQRALNDPAAFDFVESLTTEIGQRLAGTKAHRRAVAWAEARLKAAGFENVHSEPFTFPAWIRSAESAEIVGSVPQHLAGICQAGSCPCRKPIRLAVDRSEGSLQFWSDDCQSEETGCE